VGVIDFPSTVSRSLSSVTGLHFDDPSTREHCTSADDAGGAAVEDIPFD